jgi:hypothetical protein
MLRVYKLTRLLFDIYGLTLSTCMNHTHTDTEDFRNVVSLPPWLPKGQTDSSLRIDGEQP